MLKFVDTKEVFAEIPDEITLAISISGCPIHCKGCHSRYLWADVGEELTVEVLAGLLESHVGVTCVCFMGGDNDPLEVNRLAEWTKGHTSVRTAWYSGRDELTEGVEPRNFDYLKIGRYDEERGSLDSVRTNQILWRVVHAEDGTHKLENVTNHFWKHTAL